MPVHEDERCGCGRRERRSEVDAWGALGGLVVVSEEDVHGVHERTVLSANRNAQRKRSRTLDAQLERARAFDPLNDERAAQTVGVFVIGVVLAREEQRDEPEALVEAELRDFLAQLVEQETRNDVRADALFEERGLCMIGFWRAPIHVPSLGVPGHGAK